MRRSNRTLNRIVLALTGLLLLGVAAVAAWPALADLLPTVPAVPRLGRTDATTLWWIAGGCAVLIVLALLWITSRGRGGTPTAHAEDRTALDVHVIRDLLAQGIERHPSVVGVDATAHRLRGRTAIALKVRARRGSDLPALIERVRAAVADLDSAVGRRLPLVVRVTASGIARGRRAE